MVSSSFLMGLEKETVNVVVITRVQQLVNPPTEHMAEPSTPSDGLPNFV